MVYIVEGNVLDAKEDIIAHQVNCKGVMGSGVAKAIRARYDREVFDSYQKYCATTGSNLLGKIQVLKMSNNKRICNMFAQDAYGWDKQYTDEEAFKSCVSKLFLYAKQRNLSVAMPYLIGCGRGGADWIKIYSIILNESNVRDVNVTLYSF